MKVPGFTIATLMAVICAVGLDITVFRAFFESHPPSPKFEALLLGVPLTAIALQVGLIRALVCRGRDRVFCAGFLILGFLSVGTFIAAFVGFPGAMETPLFVWGAYFELTGALLYKVLPPWVVTQYWFAWWLGAAVLLALPHMLLASTGGLLFRRLRRTAASCHT